ncbi:glycosyltransferase family 9 protein [Dysgonomonas sp. HGC4]|uniref:glycosyltransferase family 9 protein n=1 Tax=Dysgonomonas sp. HGC4 TaxID=1658009 RepID=UPI0006825E66|nr:glycosyltransferase family 9 protein [Dysgonomonas sp. HGC4]MBD8346999.1 glycosyltransferase family 9 protein [Dysgonomonas sp. HGC4]
MPIRNILIIRFRRVGDATLSSALCTSLHKSFPDSEIHMVLNENIAPLFDHHPDIHKIITFSDDEASNLRLYIPKVISIIKKGQYDIIIDERSTIKTLFFSLFSIRTKYRIGRKKSYNKFIHNYRVDNFPNGTRDNISLNFELLAPLEADHTISKDPIFRLFVTQEEKNAFRKYMESAGVDFSRPVIICTVTARAEFKAWDKSKMKIVLQNILDKYKDTQLIFNYGGEKEKEAAMNMYEALNRDPRIFINVEAKNLRDLLAMLANSDFLFGNEGGPRHISQALDIPSFAIFLPNVRKIEWLPNASEKYQGIELADINIEAANNPNLLFEEKRKLIDEKSVWEKLDNMLKIYLPESKNQPTH